jgi:hypothetical protein
MTTKDSDLVTNYQATPPVANPAHQLGGVKRVAQGTLELATTDLDNNDIVMLAPVPSNASITSIQIATDDLDTASPAALAWNIGLYDKDETVIDEDCYATAATAGQAAQAFTEYRWEVADINTTGQQVWEDGGLSADSGEMVYVALTASAAAGTPAAGTLSYKIEFVVN